MQDGNPANPTWLTAPLWSLPWMNISDARAQSMNKSSGQMVWCKTSSSRTPPVPGTSTIASSTIEQRRLAFTPPLGHPFDQLMGGARDPHVVKRLAQIAVRGCHVACCVPLREAPLVEARRVNPLHAACQSKGKLEHVSGTSPLRRSASLGESGGDSEGAEEQDQSDWAGSVLPMGLPMQCLRRASNTDFLVVFIRTRAE